MKNLLGEEIVEEEEYVLPERKKRNVFDYVKSINQKKPYLGEELEDYSSFIVSKALAGSLDCVLIVAEFHRYPVIFDRMEYDYYLLRDMTVYIINYYYGEISASGLNTHTLKIFCVLAIHCVSPFYL